MTLMSGKRTLALSRQRSPGRKKSYAANAGLWIPEWFALWHHRPGDFPGLRRDEVPQHRPWIADHSGVLWDALPLFFRPGSLCLHTRRDDLSVPGGNPVVQIAL